MFAALLVHEGMDITTLVQWEAVAILLDKVAANAAPNLIGKTRREAPRSSNGAIKSPTLAAVKTEPAVKLDGKVLPD